jgi:NADPH2:quinone reductase
MKAILCKAFGPPESLVFEEVASPAPGPGEAVVSVKAASVNFPDVLIIENKYQLKPPLPFSPGSELAGIVKAVGDGVTHVKPGDRVMAITGYGAFAEEVKTEARRMLAIPPGMDFATAAAFGLTYATSEHALVDRGALKAGETLLVLGAAGGVGLAAVELGKSMGARVVAACSSQEKVDLAKSHGADAGVVYPRGPTDRDGQRALTDAFKAACGPAGADVIYDAVGGDYAEPALRSIAWEGRYLVVGFAAGDIPRIPLNLTLLKGCSIVGVFWGAWLNRNPRAHAAAVGELLQLYAKGAIRPHVSERFALERGGEAIRRLADRKAMGKVVVVIDGAPGL